MLKILQSLHGMLWGAPVLLLILGVGIYLTVRTGFGQLTLFPEALGAFVKSMLPSGKDRNTNSSFRALCTALAATVGTGNLVGVAGALCLGGPGAVFWMWICGFLGMILKFAEVTLAVRFAQKQGKTFVGGPMYVISRGMGPNWDWLARCYCFLGIVASFGVGNATQVNAMLTGIRGILSDISPEKITLLNGIIGVLLAALTGWTLSGGGNRIGRLAERLIPFAAGGYILLCAGVLILRRRFLPEAVASVFQGAFSPRAVTGGVIGSSFTALKIGCSRGVFTNEAGMGTASIAHAGARRDHPVQQGMMGIIEVFLDTHVICTLTALVILSSGIRIPYGVDAGGELTAQAFSSVYGSGVRLFLTGSICCFGFAAILGWGLYGGRCVQFLFGSGAWSWYVAAQTAVVILGTVSETQMLWLFAEIFNGLMAAPNLIALAYLSPEILRLTSEYKEKFRLKKAGGGTYADFHQRKPL